MIKLVLTVAHQRQTVATGVGSNMQIINADGFSDFFQPSANVDIAHAALSLIRKNDQSADKILDHRQIPRGGSLLFSTPWINSAKVIEETAMRPCSVLKWSRVASGRCLMT